MTAHTHSAPVSPAAGDKGPKGETATVRRWPWHPLQSTVLVVGIFILSQLLAFLLATMLATLFGQLAGWDASRIDGWLDGGTDSQFVIIVLAEAFVIGMVYWLFRRQGIGFRDIGFTKPALRDFVSPLVGFLVYFLLYLVLVGFIQLLVPGIDINQKQDIGFDDANSVLKLIMVFFALVVCAPLAEEVLFRGFLFGSLRQRMPFVAAMLITSVFFGAAHLLGGEAGASLLWIAGIDTMVLSFVLCYLREHTGKLWAPVLLHAAKNAIAFVLLFVVGIN